MTHVDLVRSHRGLSDELGKDVDGLSDPATRQHRVAVFGIHGVSPIQRYAFQDQVADGLLGYLQARSGPDTWDRSVYWPPTAGGTELKPSAVRIFPKTSGPDGPTSYDVYEGYWSPLSKGKTNIASLLTWLLSASFLSTSSTAFVPCSWRKLGWDFGYIAVVLAVAAAIAGVAFYFAGWALKSFAHLYESALNPPHVPTSLTALLSEALALGWAAYVELGLLFVVGYCLAQFVNMYWARHETAGRTDDLRKDASTSQDSHFRQATISAGNWHHRAFAFLVFLTLVAISAAIAFAYDQHMPQAVPLGGFLLLTVGALQLAQFLADFVVTEVLGDVQVYTTHDTNAVFFAIRQAIIACVAAALLGVLRTIKKTGDDGEEQRPLYDEIHILAHSLGSTIGLDVLMRIAMLLCEHGVMPDTWGRIRSFVTFGTALEKTRFFFDVRQPTVSAAHDQWDADVFGRYFSDQEIVLKNPSNAQGIYWRNVYYRRDIVANRLLSYTSEVPAGGKFSDWPATVKARPLSENTRIDSKPPFWRFVHGDYLEDPQFWAIAGKIIAGA